MNPLLLAAALFYALVSVPVASFRVEPTHRSELETQAPMGTPVLIDSIAGGEWCRALLPDSARGWVNISGIAPLPDEIDFDRWRSRKRLVVTNPVEQPVYADSVGSRLLSRIVCGSIVADADLPAGGRPPRAAIEMPTGAIGWIDRSSVTPLDLWSRRNWSTDSLLSIASSLIDTPYLWGGTSTKMLDCSGFTKICYAHAGAYNLPRNASQQATVGTRIDDPVALLPADLLFFLSPATGRVNHVGIYLGDGLYIHASGRVYISSLDPDDPLWCPKIYSHAVRIPGSPGADALRYSASPWYFIQQSPAPLQ